MKKDINDLQFLLRSLEQNGAKNIMCNDLYQRIENKIELIEAEKTSLTNVLKASKKQFVKLGGKLCQSGIT